MKKFCHAYEYVMSHTQMSHGAHEHDYGVATSSRLLKIIGLFCKRAL